MSKNKENQANLTVNSNVSSEEEWESDLLNQLLIWLQSVLQWKLVSNPKLTCDQAFFFRRRWKGRKKNAWYNYCTTRLPPLACYAAVNHVADLSENKRDISERSTGHAPGSWLGDFDPFCLFLFLDDRYDNDWRLNFRVRMLLKSSKNSSERRIKHHT